VPCGSDGGSRSAGDARRPPLDPSTPFRAVEGHLFGAAVHRAATIHLVPTVGAGPAVAVASAIRMHRAELQHAELLTATTDADLPVDDARSELQTDQERDAPGSAVNVPALPMIASPAIVPSARTAAAAPRDSAPQWICLILMPPCPVAPCCALRTRRSAPYRCSRGVATPTTVRSREYAYGRRGTWPHQAGGTVTALGDHGSVHAPTVRRTSCPSFRRDRVRTRCRPGEGVSWGRRRRRQPVLASRRRSRQGGGDAHDVGSCSSGSCW
jgi:hypothetical protein